MDRSEQECREVEAQIADELARFARPRFLGGALVSPPPYVRRHAVEHAAAGGALDDRFLSAEFLPFVDAGRLRGLQAAAESGAAGVRETRGARLLQVWRQTAHGWGWESPQLNANTLAFWSMCAGLPLVGSSIPLFWEPRWTRWALGGGEILGRHSGPVCSVAAGVLPDGREVAVTAGEDRAVRVWDLATGQANGSIPVDHTGPVISMATGTLPDGRGVVVTAAEDGAARVWDLATGRAVGGPLAGHTGKVGAVAVGRLPDGRPVALTGSWDETVRVWDLATGRPSGAPLVGHTGRVVAIATVTLPDGRCVAVTTGFDRTVRRWDLATGRPMGGPLTGHTSAVRGLAAGVLPDGGVVAVSAGDDGTVRVWDLRGGRGIGLLGDGGEKPMAPVAMAVLPDGRNVVVTAAAGSKVRLWDLATMDAIGEPLAGHTGAVRALAARTLPDGRFVTVSVSDDHTVRVWDLAVDGGASPEPHGDPVAVAALATAVLRDGRGVVVLAGRGEATMRVLDLADGQQIGAPLHGHTNAVKAVATTVLRQWRVAAVSVGEDDTARLWDLASQRIIGEPRSLFDGGGWGEELAAYLGVRDPLVDRERGLTTVATAVLSGDRDVAAMCGSNGALLCDLTTGELRSLPVSGVRRQFAVVTRHDGAVLLAFGGYHRGALDLHGGTEGGRPVYADSREGGSVHAVAAAALPDGRCVGVAAGADDFHLRVWDLATGGAIGNPLTGHTGKVQAIAAGSLPDGRTVAVSTADDGTVRMWDLTTLQQVGPHLLLPGVARAVALARGEDGGLLVVLGGDGLAVVSVHTEGE